MASAVLFTHEHPRRGVSSFEALMKQSKNNKARNRKHISAAVVGDPEAVADSDVVHHAQLYAGVGDNLLGYPKSHFPSESDETSFKRKSISLNTNILQESHSTGLVRGASFSSMSKEQRRQLRKKLRLDLEQVRSLSLKLEAKEQQLKSISHSVGFHTSHSDAHLSRTENRCSLEKEVTSEPPLTTPGNMRFGQNVSKLARQASFYSSDCGTRGAVGKEKRTPKANQMYLNSEFLSGKERMPPPEKLKPKVASGTKRNQGKDNGLDQKRQKLISTRSRRMADIMKQCGTVLKKLMTHKHAWVFNEPVDAVKLQLPDYHKVIQNPMDLGTVKIKLEVGRYNSPLEFAEDVQLTFANAMKYNPIGNDVHAMADILRKIFEERWRSIKEKLDEENLKIRVEDEVLSEQGCKSQQLQDLRRHLRNIEDQIISIAKNNQSKPIATSRSAAPSSQKKETPKREMTFDEKSKLSVNLERLPGNKSQEIIQIIKRNSPSLNQSQIGDTVEIEVDIDSVDNETLWELHRFVTNCMKYPKKPRKKATEEAKVVRHMQAGNNGENVFGHAGTSLIKNRKNDVGDDDVDIDDDMPSAQFPPVVVEKDAIVDVSKSSSSSGSSSDSGSSSSDSDSGSSTGSESEAGDIQSGIPD
ncbi:hypothetical protein O6H91_04G063400 [Diphasiastrum complanatum]|uniref:Uncharacterized protein n=2 Tax=Diphasiastrum complanatum TaxID=34168 RepID=A0ACC2DXI9_DIPCM|nr:hypothetical protein O6H91_04G063400 [Diphasiastrum complanatum]KAJ7558963.1 hypothetical protein O6H91_04G063400 [Diphasiastrum complanatum]